MLIGVADPMGRTLSFTYEGGGHLATITTPDGSVTQFGYAYSSHGVNLAAGRL